MADEQGGTCNIVRLLYVVEGGWNRQPPSPTMMATPKKIPPPSPWRRPVSSRSLFSPKHWLGASPVFKYYACLSYSADTLSPYERSHGCIFLYLCGPYHQQKVPLGYMEAYSYCDCCEGNSGTYFSYYVNRWICGVGKDE